MSLFIAGAHTEIGKTYVACRLIEAARARGLTCAAFKPVLSGFDPGDWADSDSGRLLQALGTPLDEAALDAISPWRFAAPLAPPMAARLEGRRLELAPLITGCRTWTKASEAALSLVESAGGVMSPIAEDGLVVDLAQALDLPCMLVGGSYLGAISHTLTALEVLRARGLAVKAVVVSQDASPDAPDFSDTVQAVRRFAGPPAVLGAERNGRGSWAGELLDLVLG
jgi:dethiobiotin synthetase